MYSSRVIGKMRVHNIFSDSAVYPRMGLRVGCTLYEVPGFDSPQGLLVGYELRTIAGELRIGEHGPTVGTVLWTERQRRLRSSSHPHEHLLKLTCDLDHLRIERIESTRGTKPPTFWLELWPGLAQGAEPIDVETRPIELRIDRDRWLEFLSRSRATHYEVLEIRYNPDEAAAFQSALDHVRTARASIDAGDSKAAVGACRLALDAILDEHPVISRGSRNDQIKALWTLAENRAHAGSVEQYRVVFSKLQSLTSTTHHNYGSKVEFRRAEALFAVRMTESLLALLGDLTAKE